MSSPKPKPSRTSKCSSSLPRRSLPQSKIVGSRVQFPAGTDPSVKFGYPPKPLTQTDGPLSSIPITRGEQIIVTAVPAVPATNPVPEPRPAYTPAPSVKPMNDAISAPSPPRPQTPLAENDIPLENAESVALPGRDAGFLQLRVVPDDNSCLFSSIAVVFEGGIQGGKALRQGWSKTRRQ